MVLLPAWLIFLMFVIFYENESKLCIIYSQR